ncbi:hypothetical protein [Citrobacter youngae]|uniref:hypothetical protein n=1 Tax=Citrobacter youngae TaxID=133448 RepID=UPI003979625B
MVILVVLTTPIFRFSLSISQLMAKEIPVRGAIFREARLRKLKRAFCLLISSIVLFFILSSCKG